MAQLEANSNTAPDPSTCPYNPLQPMLDYDPPFNEEFTADAEYWDRITLPWNEEDEEELNIEFLLYGKNDF